MRRNRALALWTALVLLCGCGADTVPEARRSVALVSKSTETEFWLSAFAGAQAAAAEYNLELTISGPGTEEDYETQNKMIAQAVENGAEVIVFSAIDYERNAQAEQRQRPGAGAGRFGQPGRERPCPDRGCGQHADGRPPGPDGHGGPAAGPSGDQCAHRFQ